MRLAHLNPNKAGLLSTRNVPGIGTLCQALYLQNYWSYDHETSQGSRGRKTVEPKIFLATSDYPTSGYEGQRQIFLFLYKCSDFVVFFADMKLKFLQVVVIMFENMLWPKYVIIFWYIFQKSRLVKYVNYGIYRIFTYSSVYQLGTNVISHWWSRLCCKCIFCTSSRYIFGKMPFFGKIFFFSNSKKKFFFKSVINPTFFS